MGESLNTTNVTNTSLEGGSVQALGVLDPVVVAELVHLLPGDDPRPQPFVPDLPPLAEAEAAAHDPSDVARAAFVGAGLYSIQATFYSFFLRNEKEAQAVN